MRSEVLLLEGHIIDSRTLPQLLDLVIEFGCDYELLDVSVGKTQDDHSRARVEVRAPDEDTLDRLLSQATHLGARVLHDRDASLEIADLDGVFPEDFYATTNLATDVRIDGRWIPVEHPEMDCGIVVRDGAARTSDIAIVRATGTSSAS